MVTGKWMIITGPDIANRMWQAIANGLLNDGNFPECIIHTVCFIRDSL